MDQEHSLVELPNEFAIWRKIRVHIEFGNSSLLAMIFILYNIVFTWQILLWFCTVNHDANFYQLPAGCL